jgi:hypothetical protein
VAARIAELSTISSTVIARALVDGTTQMVSYKNLVSGAPTTCEITFAYDGTPLPWPPSPNATVQSTTPSRSSMGITPLPHA